MSNIKFLISKKHAALAIIMATCIIITMVGFYLFQNNKSPLPTSNASIDTLEDAWAVAAQNIKDTNQTTEVTFLAVGDISLSRNIAYTIQKNGNDPDYPFRNISALLKSTDFNFGNLETPFSSSDRFTPSNTLVFNAPKLNVKGLVDNNFKILNLANNHSFDQGMDGIRTTQKVLKENDIQFMGTGESLDESWQPAIIEKNGIKIGFIGASYASINDGGKSTNNFVSRIEDISHLQLAIRNTKLVADFLVVTMHAGTEYTTKPNQSQIDFAHAAIDAGADMVIGAHPHWVQEKEIYCPKSVSSPVQGEARWGENSAQLANSNEFTEPKQTNCKPIYYSLGNFIFDQSWSKETTEGLALKITLNKTVSSLSPSEGKDGLPASERLWQAGDGLYENNSPTTIKSLEEIPIKIENNCCAVVSKKE
jgi:poly-gamma-glutamate synthesis protein (capsule biosynthesis protein)